LLKRSSIVGYGTRLPQDLDVAHSDVDLAFVAKDSTNLSLKVVKILHLGVNLIRGFVSYVLDKE
jgi:hypothetical protein